MRTGVTLCVLSFVLASCGDDAPEGTSDGAEGVCADAACTPGDEANDGPGYDGAEPDGGYDGAEPDGGYDGVDDGGSSSDGSSDLDAGEGDGRTDDGGDGVPDDGGADGEQPAREIALPPENGVLDYQLGGAYAPPEGVTVVSRDREADIAPGIYNICYVNGFQVQPGEEDAWPADLILRDAAGDPVIDPDWDEALLDTTTEDKRVRIAEVVGAWIDGCADAGFDAIEIDNLDTFSRSSGRLTEDDAVALMALLSARAHAAGLASAQKNSAELLERRAELGTDFVVSEECSRYDECQDYVSAYGSAVLMIEYRRQDFDQGCREFGDSHAIVLRDLDLVPAGERGYVYEGC